MGKKDEYVINSREVYYSKNEDGTYQYTNSLEIKALTNGVDHIKKRYAWSGGDVTEISPLEGVKAIESYGFEDNERLVGVVFEKILMKNDTIRVGYALKNMKDNEGKARPFLTTRITERTAFLSQTVKLQERPNEVKLIVTNATGKVCDEKVLKYDGNTKKITSNIEYPRLGWKYTIKWDLY